MLLVLRRVSVLAVTALCPIVLTAQAAPSVPAAAAPPPAPPAAELQAAATLFAASDWKAANAAYAAIAARFPKHAFSRFRTGVTLTELGRAAEGEPMLREGERLGAPAPQAAYRLAESLAEQHKNDAAISELARAQRGGLGLTGAQIEGNAHLAKLKSHAKWNDLVLAFNLAAAPCTYDPRFRQFDFWVGDWDVRPTGQPPLGPASRNNITLEDGRCIVQEHWTGLGGSTGQSFNLFDRSIGKWRQTWVDNSGGQHDYVGELKDGNMVFEGTTPAPNGQLGRVATRLTLFHISADSVRQFSQVSSDSGRTWQVAYDFMYIRKKP